MSTGRIVLLMAVGLFVVVIAIAIAGPDPAETDIVITVEAKDCFEYASFDDCRDAKMGLTVMTSEQREEVRIEEERRIESLKTPEQRKQERLEEVSKLREEILRNDITIEKIVAEILRLETERRQKQIEYINFNVEYQQLNTKIRAGQGDLMSSLTDERRDRINIELREFGIEQRNLEREGHSIAVEIEKLEEEEIKLKKHFNTLIVETNQLEEDLDLLTKVP